MTTATHDPFDSAVEAGERTPVFYGQLDVTASWVALIKGQGKVVWTEAHGIEQRRTEVAIRLNPLDITGMTRMVERSIIAESREWSGVVWPSARDLGVRNPRELSGKYAKIELVKSGRTWQNREGMTVEGTTIKFLAIYDTKTECEAAFDADHSDAAAAPSPTPAPATNGNGASFGKEAAAAFLPALVAQANGDRNALATLLAGMPLIAKHFTVDSPEVQTLLAA